MHSIPDGQSLTSASENKTAQVSDAPTGQEPLMFKEHAGPVAKVAFSPDGHRLAGVWVEGTVEYWDATPLPEKP